MTPESRADFMAALRRRALAQLPGDPAEAIRIVAEEMLSEPEARTTAIETALGLAIELERRDNIDDLRRAIAALR